MKLIRWNLHTSSHMRLFFLFVAVLMIPVVVISVFFIRTSHDIFTEKHQQSLLHEFNTLSYRFDFQIQDITDYLSLLSQDKAIYSIVASGEPMSDDSTKELANALDQYSFVEPIQLHPEIIIIGSDHRFLIGKEYLNGISADTMYDTVSKSYMTSYRNTVWISDAELLENETSDPVYFYLARPIINTENWKPLGFAILRIRTSSLVSMILNYASDGRSAFVVDRHGRVLAQMDNFRFSEKMSDTFISSLTISPERLNEEEGAWVISHQLPNQWYLISASRTEYLSADLSLLFVLYGFVLVLICIVTFILAYVFSKRFVIPINQLIAQMNEVKRGNLKASVKVSSKDEIAELAENYNEMIGAVDSLMQRITDEQEQRRKADILALQSQINPHFLVNTLTSIRYMIYTSPPQDVDVMVSSLTKILNWALSDTSPFCTLDMELEQLRNYITIQKFGFDAPLRFQVEMEDGLGDYLIIKLLLQPLVENAILHGLKPLRESPELKLTISSAPRQMICIRIADNGVGFDDAAQKKSDRLGLPHSIGISNVLRRLQLHYGSHYSFDIDSTPGCGTTIAMYIPKQRSEDLKDEDSGR